MQNIRIYRSAMFNISSMAGHVYVYSPDTKTGIGMGTSQGSLLEGDTKYGTGVRSLNNPYVNIKVPSASKFMSKLQSYPGWHKGIWLVYINDCHTQLEQALLYTSKRSYSQYMKVKHPRVDLSQTFRHKSLLNSLSKNISNMFASEVQSKLNQKRTNIARMIMNTARSNHKFKSQSGRLQNSIRANQIDKDTIEIKPNAEYASNVMIKTKDDFMSNAVKLNESRIQSELQNIKIDTKHIDKSVENYGQIMMETQFDSLLLR